MADQLSPPNVGVPAAQAQKPAGLFAAKPKKDAPDVHLNELIVQLTNVSRRLRILEERYGNLRTKTQVTDQNMIADHKRVMTEIKATDARVDELRKDINQLRDSTRIIIAELRECAKKEDVAVLSKYINLWEPMQFVTRPELQRAVQEELTRLLRAQAPKQKL